MKRSNVDTSTPNSSSKRTRSNEENEEGPPPDLLRYENYEQFKELMGKSDFAKKLSHPSNQDIVHRLVTDTRNCSEKDIDERTKVLSEIISNRLALLHYQAYDELHTPLHQPNVHIKLITFLVKSGVPMYSVTRSCRFSFVHLVTFYFNPEEFQELVAYLLEMGFDKLINTTDCNGLTPIHLAVYNIEVKRETILLCRDSEHVRFDLTNDVDAKGNNVLAFAVMGGRNEGYLNLLQELGALPTVNFVGYSVLHHAAAYGNLDAIKLFGTGDHLYLEAPGGLTPVHVALSLGRRNIHDVVEALLRRCKDYVTLPDDEGQTPLWWAKKGPLKEIIEPRTVELLKNELTVFKANLKQGNSTTAHGFVKIDEGVTAEIERDAISQDHVTPDFEDEIIDPIHECGTVDVSSGTPSIGDIGSKRAGSGDDHDIRNSLKYSNARDKAENNDNPNAQKEALPETLDNNVNQDASPNASYPAEETGNSVVVFESAICNMETATPLIDSEPEIEVLGSSYGCEDSSSSISDCSTACTNKAIHDLVSNSLDCVRKEVELKKNAITAILQTRPELLNMKVEDDEKTPILCEKVHFELLKFLISNGADVSAKTREGETVLHLAARYLDPEEYHKLVIIVQKTNPKILKAATSSEKYLAFHLACHEMEVKKETLQAFQNSGVDLTSRCDWDRENVLSVAVKGGRTVKFLKTLLSLGLKPLSRKEGFENTLVHYAARYSSLNVLKFVIQLSPADINALNSHHQNPLQYALSGDVVTENHVKITNALLHRYKVKESLKEEKMRDVIHYVAQNSVESSTEEIDRRKKIIDLLTECDGTLLNAEVWYDHTIPLEGNRIHPELLKYLIVKGCDPRHRCDDRDRNTFLVRHLVAKQFSAEQCHDLILFLVKNGYQDVLETKNSRGETPLHHAVWGIELKEETIEVFKTHGGLNHVDNDGRNIIWYACMGRRSLDLIKMLMKKADMGVDDIGISALHVVAEHGDLEVLKYFLELKPEWVNLKNPENGKTPLHVVVERGRYDTNRLHQAKDFLRDLKEKKVLTQEDIQELIQTCIENAGFSSKKRRYKIVKIVEQLTHS